MNKLEFISRQFSRAENKVFEHYVITRIWHLLNDTDVKFITQQYVKRPSGIALTDMYFPQLKVHIEIDEGHHKLQIDTDKVREADIINITGHCIKRVDVTQDLKLINESIDSIIIQLKQIKDQLVDFTPWNIEAEQNPDTYIKKGYIDLQDDVAFNTMVDAANCFGNDYKPKGIWTGGAKHPNEADTFIWFPKLYKNSEWNNSISNDENVIKEYCETAEKKEKHIDKAIKNSNIKRIVFARVKSPLGDTMYRFKGEYKVDIKKTNYQEGVVLNRIKTRVNTYERN